MAAVVPVTRDESSGQTLRVVLLLDLGKRKVAEEMLRAHEPGIPRQQLAELLDAAASLYTLDAITGKGEASTLLREQVGKYIPRQTPALISGPRGSGKRHVANVLHYSSQATGPILGLRCGSQSSDELELELFGYVKGSSDVVGPGRHPPFGGCGQSEQAASSAHRPGHGGPQTDA
jgi:transcriptional regulator with AAA-type ATPase domain